MQASEALNLIQHPYFNSPGPKSWADLGAGGGTFTRALAGLLPSKSVIHVMDMNQQSLDKIPATYRDVSVQKWRGDFVKEQFLYSNLDGILMANSMHYVKDKNSFIEKLIPYFNLDGVFLIIEYDTDISNQWVPYPVKFTALKQLFSKAGYPIIEKINEMPSVYNQGTIYSALIQSRS